MTDIAPDTSQMMKDKRGRYVPIANVRQQDVLEDDLVKEMVAKADKASASLVALRNDLRSDIAAFIDLLGEKYGVARGGPKGNMTLQSYDGTLKVEISVGDFVEFGPTLQVAKALIDKCLTTWSEGAHPDLQNFVTSAFEVNKQGRLDPQRILDLRRFNIADETWQAAMKAIDDSIRVTRTKEYIRLYRRPAHDQNFEQIPLDLARV
ncbi:DUF3164 family protein [Oleomonas cavernae]|uniref:DUF3164 family protein n=1 Tax=Oleomonas cavernae TaxID=2320859 RepID=A0A418WUC3_9PROT|nr:DUF3164 family protein [Oleomonas cavernae]RJF94831.1 DUF3164 family protein [Oleomonas cavernae]